jgi:hypothetical protein
MKMMTASEGGGGGGGGGGVSCQVHAFVLISRICNKRMQKVNEMFYSILFHLYYSNIFFLLRTFLEKLFLDNNKNFFLIYFLFIIFIPTRRHAQNSSLCIIPTK